jgi:hypothetical protein
VESVPPAGGKNSETRKKMTNKEFALQVTEELKTALTRALESGVTPEEVRSVTDFVLFAHSGRKHCPNPECGNDADYLMTDTLCPRCNHFLQGSSVAGFHACPNEACSNEERYGSDVKLCPDCGECLNADVPVVVVDGSIFETNDGYRLTYIARNNEWDCGDFCFHADTTDKWPVDDFEERVGGRLL